jgi:hypothetical protein
MPQLDKLTYFTQFFWSCLFFFTFYILICNDRDGVLGISRILKLRNQLLSHSHRGNNIQIGSSYQLPAEHQLPRIELPNSSCLMEDILFRRKGGFNTGVSYMYSSLFEVSQWCKAVDLFGLGKRIYLSCFGEIIGSGGIEGNIFYLILESSYSSNSNPGITGKNDITLIHALNGQDFSGPKNLH